MDIDEFIESVKDTLNYWLGIHNDPEKWTELWLEEDPLVVMRSYEWNLDNHYFSVNMRECCAKAWFDQYNWYKCPECGLVTESSVCDCCESDCEEATEQDLIEYAIETEWEFDEYTIRKAMEKYAFPIYQEALAPYIGTIIEDVQAAIERLDSANDRNDMLVAVLAALGILHHSGNIVDDYGEMFDLNRAMVNTVRDGGIAALFSKTEIEEWLADG